MMLFDAIARHDPDKIALRDAEESLTYGDLEKELSRRVDALYGAHVLALSMDNGVEWILWDLAAMKAGVPLIPLPHFFTDEQVTHVIRSAGVTHLLSPEGLRRLVPGGEHISVLPEGTAKVTFTSGTTGTPKGVCLPVRAMMDVAGSIVKVLGKDFAKSHTSALPLPVLLENVAGVYAALIAGCTITLPSLTSFGSQYENLHAEVNKTEAQSLILVPEILRILMMQVAVKGPLPSLKFIAVGGSKVDPALIHQARHMGLPVYEGYGLSECASVVAMNTPKCDKPGSVGKVLPHVCALIQDGEIVIKSPGFLGYIGETAPEVFATGDIGDLDDDDIMVITGRKKNVLITSYGRNVSPEWVEATLLNHPAIAQVIVYGDAQPHLSAIIVPSSPTADIKSAVEVSNKTLPDYAQIKDYIQVPPFTLADGLLTGTGRPRRERILNHYLTNKETANDLLQQTR